ncbi:MAG TPA: dolichyl-phosphate beta-glucosyltransferase [Planctomycetota bacterium]|nr:dolichyl-phosphate beta-glucosyltransferase [Planctomycetota bacterium]
MRLSIVIPALNEAERLPATLAVLRAFLRQRGEPAEILVVDDGSTDGTADLARAVLAGEGRVVSHAVRRGKGAAVRTGVAAARGEWILVTDADLSIPIVELDKLEAASADAPIVIGSKRLGGGDLRYPLLRRLGSAVGQLCIRALVVRGFADTQCGFKLFRADVARVLTAHQRLRGFGYDFELLFLARRAGLPVREVPVACRHRPGSSVRVSAYAETLREALAVAWLRLRGAYPSRSELHAALHAAHAPVAAR